MGGALLCQSRCSGQSLPDRPTDQSDKDDYSTETLFQMITGYVKFRVHGNWDRMLNCPFLFLEISLLKHNLNPKQLSLHSPVWSLECWAHVWLPVFNLSAMCQQIPSSNLVSASVLLIHSQKQIPLSASKSSSFSPDLGKTGSNLHLLLL